MPTGVSKYNINSKGIAYYTKGNQFTVKETGQEYRGVYHIANGKTYTGKPGNERPKELLPLIYDRFSTYTYDKVSEFKKKVRTYKRPRYFRPTPVDKDYRAGYIFRYIVTHNLQLTKSPTEITPKSADLFGGPGGIDPGLYTLHKVKWVIAGDAVDYKTQGGVILSIENQNRDTVAKIARKYPTIVFAFKNFTEFAELTFR